MCTYEAADWWRPYRLEARVCVFVVATVVVVAQYFPREGERVCVHPTCFMAVTVITKKRGRPLVTGLVGVSMISCEREAERGGKGGQREGRREFAGGRDNRKKKGQDAK